MLTSASWQSAACLVCSNRDILQTWSPVSMVDSNSLVCYQHKLGKIPVILLPKAISMASVKVVPFWWIWDWRCAYNRRCQLTRSFPQHGYYQLAWSPSLGCNDISWLAGLMPGLIFTMKAKSVYYITWQVEFCSSHHGWTYSSSSHVSPHEVIICRSLGKITTRVKENSLSINTSSTSLALRLPL